MKSKQFSVTCCGEGRYCSGLLSAGVKILQLVHALILDKRLPEMHNGSRKLLWKANKSNTFNEKNSFCRCCAINTRNVSDIFASSWSFFVFLSFGISTAMRQRIGNQPSTDFSTFNQVTSSVNLWCRVLLPISSSWFCRTVAGKHWQTKDGTNTFLVHNFQKVNVQHSLNKTLDVHLSFEYTLDWKIEMTETRYYMFPAIQ